MKVFIYFITFFFSITYSAYCKNYGADFWNSIKNDYTERIIDKIENDKPKESQLLCYYYKKYTAEQKNGVKEAVKTLMPYYNSVETADAVAEVLAYRHIVYHETTWHKLNKNIETVRKYRDLIEYFSHKYDLPAQAALAVIAWENSGNVSNISYASCAGLGQLSAGAVRRSHDYAMNISRLKKREATKLTGDEKKQLLAQADFFNLDFKHKALCKKYNIDDERLIPACNIEDTVIYLKILTQYFADRADLGISAYHKGVQNNDDLIKALPLTQSKMPFAEFIEKNNINYLTLWQDTKVRDMMNGYLTMDGELTTEENRSEALGDESDIYPWKVIGAYAALLQSKDQLDLHIDSARGSIGSLECRDLTVYDDKEKLDKGIKEGALIKIEAINNGKYEPYFVTPELAGFLLILRDDISKTTGRKKFYLPLKNLLGYEYIKKHNCSLNNLQGVACDFDFGNIESESYSDKLKLAAEIKQKLNYYYLHDKIYLKRNGDTYSICLNPRYGLEFYNASKHLPREQPKQDFK